MRLWGQSIENNWKPETLDMNSVYAKVKRIPHHLQQDICVLIEEADYLDVVIYNERVYASFGRFIIAKQYFWTDDEEQRFGRLLREENIAFDAKQMYGIYKRYAESYPEWHLKRYANKPLRLLEHIYHCTNPGSVKEILYKAGLDELAARLYEISDYNMIGSSPSEIFGGLSMRTLKAVNNSKGVHLLESEQKRQRILVLQSKYAWMFEQKWNESMCRYMNQLLQEDVETEEIAKKFRKEYEHLETFWTNSQYCDYVSRICQREEVEKRIEKNLLKELSEVDIRELYRILVIEGERWNQQITVSNRKRDMVYEYADEKYTFFFPKTIEDIIYEALIQKNCLLDYRYSYVDNETDILLLRKTENPKVPFVTVELQEGILVQARRKCNEKAEEEVLDWLEMYIDRRKFANE